MKEKKQSTKISSKTHAVKLFVEDSHLGNSNWLEKEP